LKPPGIDYVLQPKIQQNAY